MSCIRVRTRCTPVGTVTELGAERLGSRDYIPGTSRAFLFANPIQNKSAATVSLFATPSKTGLQPVSLFATPSKTGLQPQSLCSPPHPKQVFSHSLSVCHPIQNRSAATVSLFVTPSKTGLQPVSLFATPSKTGLRPQSLCLPPHPKQVCSHSLLSSFNDVTSN
jgi:hypothetical protein